MPATGRPRSAEAHAAILDATIALVREVGYDAVAMEAIAARAGVGKTTVYRRWASKELIVAEAVGRFVRNIPVPDTGHVSRDLIALLRTRAAMYRDPATGPLLSGLVAAMARSEHVATAIREGFVAQWRSVVREVLRRAVKRGELRTGLDADVVIDMLSGPSFYRYLMLGEAVDERYVRAVVNTLLRGLSPRSDA